MPILGDFFYCVIDIKNIAISIDDYAFHIKNKSKATYLIGVSNRLCEACRIYR